MKHTISNISDEILAAFLDGNATAGETQLILDTMSEDAELRELLSISQEVDAEFELANRDFEYIPMNAMAASCEEGAYCCLECEKYILRSYNIDFDENELLTDALTNGWTKENGTALHNVGRHLEKRGLKVTREYKATIDDLAQALNDGLRVIVAVDGGELLGDRFEEMREDKLIGPIPDHTVVVLSVDQQNNTVKIYDPNSLTDEDAYTIRIFQDAWNDSHNYLVGVGVTVG